MLQPTQLVRPDNDGSEEQINSYARIVDYRVRTLSFNETSRTKGDNQWGTVPGQHSNDREALFIRTELERQLVVSDVLARFDMSVNGVGVVQEQIVPDGQTDLTSEEDIPF